MELSGSIALVTGGSREIGKNVVQSVAERGADVILTYQSSEADAEALVAEVEGMGRRVAALQLDLDVAGPGRRWHIRRVRRSGGGGVGEVGCRPVPITTEAQFDQIMDVRIKGPYFLTQTLPPIADGGRIVNVSTVLTRVGVTYPGQRRTPWPRAPWR